MTPDEQITLGNYELGTQMVEVVVRTGTGGEYYNGESPTRIKIGVEYTKFHDVINVAMHEAMESLLDRVWCRFTPEVDWGRDHSQYLFVVDHPKFTDCCMKTSMFLEAVRDDLFVAWKLFNEEE